jgi:hypothetical protein
MDDFYFKIPQKPSESADGKKVLLFIKKTDTDVANMELLSKIMSALKLSLEEDCKIIVLNAEIHASSMINIFKQIIVFGIEPAYLGLNLSYKLYRVNHLENRTLIFSHSLAELKTDDQKKGVFWKSLQMMFNLVKS